MKITGAKVATDQMLLAAIVDNTRLLAWLQSKDGYKGTNRPKSLLAALTNAEKENSDSVVTFASGQEFDEAWERLTGKEEK